MNCWIAFDGNLARELLNFALGSIEPLRRMAMSLYAAGTSMATSSMDCI